MEQGYASSAWDRTPPRAVWPTVPFNSPELKIALPLNAAAPTTVTAVITAASRPVAVMHPSGRRTRSSLTQQRGVVQRRAGVSEGRHEQRHAQRNVDGVPHGQQPARRG